MTPKFLGRAAEGCLRALAASWRFEIVGQEHIAHVRSRAQPAVWALWHGHLLPLLWLHRNDGTTLLVSRHRDGDRFAAVAERWGYRILRGSSTRGGAAALLGLVRALRRGDQVAVAADGPRGPRERAKHGAVAAALRTGAPILPVAVAARPAWSAGSWDRLLVPAPRAHIRVAYGPPLHLSPADRRDLDDAAGRLGERLRETAMLAAG